MCVPAVATLLWCLLTLVVGSHLPRSHPDVIIPAITCTTDARHISIALAGVIYVMFLDFDCDNAQRTDCSTTSSNLPAVSHEAFWHAVSLNAFSSKTIPDLKGRYVMSCPHLPSAFRNIMVRWRGPCPTGRICYYWRISCQSACEGSSLPIHETLSSHQFIMPYESSNRLQSV
jgi:hypothetical protein